MTLRKRRVSRNLQFPEPLPTGRKYRPPPREKVRKVAAELGYRPSFIAQSLITRRSNLIGIVVPGLVNPFYSARPR
ncbi:Catabolite control protein [Raoultella planticola]|uniref:Catabolite control protein n=1 Tax=Raoultella planticola TaxID=575 RepID=A0A485B7A6_RAOPL|nr:Catabolite control protein [Raoultella planticola]